MRAQVVMENVGVRFPGRLLFGGVNWTVYEGARIALAGRNGSGKSTLLRILAGQAEASEGSCTMVGGQRVRIGYLDQAYLERAVSEAADAKAQSVSPLKYLRSKLTFDVSETTEEELEWTISRTLSGLGFTPEQMNAPYGHLSGGWLLRMFIAGTLLNRPDLLLLDEPTNHLDLSSIQWLEEYLAKEYEGSVVLITHDVELQKRTTTSLAVLHGSQFYTRSDLNDYLSFRSTLADEERIIEKRISGLEKKIKEQEKFISGFGAKARMASRAQSKQKNVDKLDIELEEAIDTLDQIRGYAFDLHFKFNMAEQGSKFPVVVSNMSYRYSENAPWILKDVNIDFNRGQKVAIIGDNGAGKTTLLNVLAQRYQPSVGSINHGHGVSTGYFGQHQIEELALDTSVLENLRMNAPGVTLGQVRGYLGAFGFCGNYEVNKPAKVLSGGEKARLALLKILVNPVNVVLLDEPTNHLDVETKALLKKAFKEYQGTMLFVSHDREFIESVADRIIYLSTTHELIDHLGDLESFFKKYPERVRHIDSIEDKTSEKKQTRNDLPQLSYEERKRLKNLRRSLTKKVTEMEKKIDDAGKMKEQLEVESRKEELYLPENADKLSKIIETMAQLDTIMGAQMIEWEKASGELSKLGRDDN